MVVSAPGGDPLRQAVALTHRLDEEGFPLMGVVLNRVHPLPPGGLPINGELEAALEGAADPAGLAGRATATLEEAQVLGLRDLDATESLRGAIDGTAIITVPAFAREPVELEGIAEVAAALGR